MAVEFRRSHVPAFGSWDCNDDLPFTQCFESARQAGLLRYSYSEDRVLYVAGDLYQNDVVTPAMILVPRTRRTSQRMLKREEKKEKNENDDYYITRTMLVEIIEESIQIFWHFLHADNDCNIVSRKGMKVELLDTTHSVILKEIRKDLQKKERRLKEQLRSGKWMLKKLWREETRDQLLLFFSQIDMKLVSRVLNMSRLTNDQLGWCHNK